MKKFYFYITLFMLLPLSYFTGGVESPFRLLYYPVMVLLATTQSAKVLVQTALIFSICYAFIPIPEAGEYPFFAVVINVAFFLIMGVISGRISDKMRQEMDSFKKTTDIYQALTNDLNLKIMNLHTKTDSLSEAYTRLKESDRNKTRFFSGVSHEIRGPLSSIRSFSEILLNYGDVGDETRREFIEIINKESERLTQLINEILDLARIESGKIEWHMDSVNLGEIVKSAVKMVVPLAKDKGIPIELNLPDKDFLSTTKGDRSRLFQVVLNLLTNAIKFTSEGKITVGIEEMPDEIKVSVTDTGEGIYPEEKEKIFEEFYRIGDELAGRPKGSGLGLSISKGIIEAHGGKIDAESRLGEGSTFFFTIPKESIVMVRKESEERMDQGIVRKVLVLEEYTHIRQVLRSAFEKMGYDTIGFGNIRMATDVMKATKIDAIVIGYFEQYEHFDELRTLSSIQSIPLVLVVVINDLELGPQIAVNGYISSPFGGEQIQSTFDGILKQQKRIVIISDDQAEARGFQLIAGTKGHETDTISDVMSINPRTQPDAIVIGTMNKEKVYRTIEYLRAHYAMRHTPIILALSIPLQDLKCIGLESAGYGSGIKRIFEGFREKVFNAPDL